jgi:hypothetical protein
MQLTRSEFVLDARQDYTALRVEFSQRQCLRLPQLIDASLLSLVFKSIAATEFYPRTWNGVGDELCMAEDSIASSLLHFATNTPSFFEFIRTMTGCPRIGSFMGRVYRFVPGQGHSDWHNDCFKHRLIGMSLNLSAVAYSGGIFALRERGSEEVLCKIANTGPGDALIFRIAPHLQHRVTEVIGNAPKTAFAGWFMSEPDFMPRYTAGRG